MIDALLSIKPQHVKNIKSGAKTVELRVKHLNLPVDSRLWIYTTLPIGEIDLHAQIDFIDSSTPEEIWSMHGRNICISREDFDRYTDGREQVTAIGLKNVNVLKRGISLESIRQQVGRFNPPQFFLKISPGSALRKVLSSLI
ncbi:hypothetical protein PPUJ20066_26130 [Pseudomonas putida]|nr:hypothetical protein PPUJ20066_26130 [Pseudomonas putida]